MLDGLQHSIEHWAGFLGENLFLQAAAVMVTSWLLALLIDKVLVASIKRLAKKTAADFDDQLIEHLHRPLILSIVLLGLGSATVLAQLPEGFQSVIFSVLYTVAMLIWTQFLLRFSHIALQYYSANPNQLKLLHSKTLPLFENIAFILIIGFAIYLIFVSWNIDMTAWLASAGIVGIAVGFAAKDTLANLFSGVFIMADAPYKIGDFVVLDAGERGEVTRIGIRSTRLLTRDDIEVTVPNGIMGNTKIINESGGRHEKFRIRVQVGVAYGSDIDLVKEVLMTAGLEEASTCSDPEPRVRFRRFGPSALEFELLCWIDQPVLRGRILDALNSAVYKAFIKEGIEIPYSKHDIYIKSMPER
ncbi:MAG: MscS family membrane protein [Halieaceae bacterium]|jgi:MscS family membrane protein